MLDEKCSDLEKDKCIQYTKLDGSKECSTQREISEKHLIKVSKSNSFETILWKKWILMYKGTSCRLSTAFSAEAVDRRVGKCDEVQ